MTVSWAPPRSSTPLVTVRLLMVSAPGMTQGLLPVTIVTLSTDPGTPLGSQFPATPQLEEIVPFQVYEVWVWACKTMPRQKASTSPFIGFEFYFYLGIYY